MQKQKDKAWEEVRTIINSSGLCSAKKTIQLKTLWKNMKCRAKKDYGKQKRAMKETGNKEVEEEGMDELSERVVRLIPEDVLKPSGEFDDDISDIDSDNEQQPAAETPTSSRPQSEPEYTVPVKKRPLRQGFPSLKFSTPPEPAKKKGKQQSHLSDTQEEGMILDMEKAEHAERLGLIKLQKEKEMLEIEVLKLRKEKVELELQTLRATAATGYGQQHSTETSYVEMLTRSDTIAACNSMLST